MAEYKLLYFNGCPNHRPAVELLESLGIQFESVCQDDLEESDLLKKYTSPTLLNNNEIIFGSKAMGGGCSMPLPSREELNKRLKP